jgi:hypothetical protein
MFFDGPRYFYKKRYAKNYAPPGDKWMRNPDARTASEKKQHTGTALAGLTLLTCKNSCRLCQQVYSPFDQQ